MKYGFLVLLILFSRWGFALESVSDQSLPQLPVVKQCSVNMQDLDSSEILKLDIQIVKLADGALEARLHQIDQGNATVEVEKVELTEQVVRPGLEKVDLESNLDLNPVEKLIVHAMSVTADLELQKYFSTGVDLNQVRSAKVYWLGEKTNMGQGAIIEAFDFHHQNLGSFLGGVIVTPCQQ